MAKKRRGSGDSEYDCRQNRKKTLDGLSAADAALWKAYAKGLQKVVVKPRVSEAQSSAEVFREMIREEGASGEAARPKSCARNTAAPSTDRASKPNTGASLQASGSKFSSIDDRSARKLGSGRLPVEARIDLHGMRQHEAHSALRAFLYRCVSQQLRFVLVITGKGAPRAQPAVFELRDPDPDRERGVLRRMVPIWLSSPELNGLVVGHRAAHPNHGGDGALYVQLRRRRGG